MGLTPADLSDLDTFEYYLRWTDPKHGGLSPAELKKIRPLTLVAAKRVFETLTHSACGPQGNVQQFLYCGATHFDAAGEVSEVSRWLGNILPGGQTDIVVSWKPDMAALIPRELFVYKWCEFCFSSCSPVTIWPPDGGYILYYDQDEVFTIKPVAL